MRAKHILNEYSGSRVKKATLAKAAELLETHCSAALRHYVNKGLVLYRGFESPESVLIGDSTQGQARVSANTKNYYTLILDNDPSWQEFPKRSRSFICSTSEGTAEVYGRAYCVFPFDGTELGVCPNSDIWNSFNTTAMGFPDEDGDLDTMVSQLHLMMWYCATIDAGIPVNKGPYKADADLKTFRTELRRTEAVLAEYEFKDFEQLTVMAHKIDFMIRGVSQWAGTVGNFIIQNRLYARPNGIWKWLVSILNPIKNGFKLTTIDQFTFPEAREIWFSGKAIFIAADEAYILKHQFVNVK